MRKAVALYYLLLTVVIGGIIALTLYAGIYYPHTAELLDERQKISTNSGEKTVEALSSAGEIEGSQPTLSPKTGGSEPWYG